MMGHESTLRQFWRDLAGPIHPLDAPVFDKHPGHTFDLQFPPPAFIGDVDRAPIVVLMANGGFHPEQTPREFPNDAAAQAYIAWLGGLRREMPEHLSTYYSARSIGPWLAQGRAVIVNAIAYRSLRLSAEPANQRLARLLPSFTAHQKWLHQELLPAAKRGERLVLVHRNGMWRVPKSLSSFGVLFSPNPISPDPARTHLELARQWLAALGDPAP